jgi:DNA polymerase elongation subunit (family B)
MEPRILFYDIETSYIKADIFRIGYNINISHENIQPGSITKIICVAWKWSDEKKVHTLDWGLKKQNCETLIKKFTKVIEKADLTVAHNGDRFDVRHLNTQRLLHNLPPIAWPATEDTLKQVRKMFVFPSNRLDAIGKFLFGEGKDKTDFDLWRAVVDRKDPKALNRMIKYCEKDVTLMEKAYNRMKAFFPPKINAGMLMYDERYRCPRCGSDKNRKDGIRLTKVNKYQRIRCNACGSVYTGPIIKK